MTLDLKKLYRGYVLSFDMLGIPIEENKRNHSLFTHSVITYWARVGRSLGYYPWCEEKSEGHCRKDLGWYEYKDEKPAVLHLESENTWQRVDITIDKLKKSEARYKVGIFFMNEKYDEEKWERKIESIQKGEALIVTTWWKEEKKDGKDKYQYLVTGHWIKNGEVEKLDPAWCVWDGFGCLRMILEDEPNWEREYE